MSPSTAGVDMSMSKIDPNASLTPSSRSPPKPSGVFPAPKAQEIATPKAQPRVWNTKNLGLRLASDFTAGFLAAGMVAPVIAVIDKLFLLVPFLRFNSDSLVSQSNHTKCLRPELPQELSKGVRHYVLYQTT